MTQKSGSNGSFKTAERKETSTMKFFWHSRDSDAVKLRHGPLRRAQPTRVPYASTLTKSAECAPGVVFTIRRLSFARRMDLSRKIREISRKIDFIAAGDELQ